MRFKLLLSTLLVSFSISVIAQNDFMPVEAQLDDLQQLKSNFEKFHAGLYKHTSKDSIDLVFRQVEERVEERSTIDFYAEVTWLLNKVKCGHTRSSAPQNVTNKFQSDHLFLPISVKYLGKRLVINEVLSNEGELKKGEEIISINDKMIPEITARIFSHHSSDGHVNTGKYRQTEQFFNYYYQLYVDRNAD